jgi:stage III sporulation protein SpoIIIAA
VRVIGSAHGDLRSLLKNKELKGLVGGTETVTVGDVMAKERQASRGGVLSKVRGQMK